LKDFVKRWNIAVGELRSVGYDRPFTLGDLLVLLYS